MMMIIISSLWAQKSLTIPGELTDEKKEALIGVTIRVKGTTMGVTTDLDGNFTLSNVPQGSVLLISYVGMKDKQITVKNADFLSIMLESSSKELDDVVVVAYGRQKKVNLTGAVSSVDSKSLEARPVANVSQAIQGLVPGLNLSVGNSGGQLDGSMSINIRGTGTISEGSSSSPLILIDGVEGNLNTLAPSDIENISVLKDASSSAIYGSRAAFGVILVTTKNGRSGRARVNYSGSIRFSTATQIPDMMDSEMFANYFNRAGVNAGAGVTFSDEMMDLIRKYKSGSQDPNVKHGTRLKPGHNEIWTKYSEGWANTDWFEESYIKNAPSHEHNLSISGGTDKLNYYLSGAILSRRGLLKPAKDEFQRYNFTAKIGSQITPWLRVDYINRWTREDFERPTYMSGLFFHNIARRWPTNAYYDPNGHLMPHNEAIQLIHGGRQNSQKDFVNQQFSFTLTPIKGLTIRLENNYNSTYHNQHWAVLPIYWYDENQNQVSAKWDDWKKPGYSDVHEDANKNNFFGGRYFAEYASVLGEKHDIKVMAGLDVDINKYRNIVGTKQDVITPLVPTLNTSTNDKPQLSGEYNHWATMGMFARANYVFDSRYLLEMSIRRDGSSRFIGDKTWATFPSFSLGWNVANEAFWKPIKSIVSQLKLRGSWGQLGNTKIKALYPWYQGLSIKGASSTSGSEWIINGSRQTTAGAPGLVSSSLTWERVESWNVGLDFSVFDNRFQGSFDYFTRSTRDMVGPAAPLSSILGAKQPATNNADLKSYGWELELRWRDNIGDLKYGAKFLLSDNQVEVTKYYNPSGTLSTWYAGKKDGEIWGYTSVGIAKTDEEITEHLKHNTPKWGNQWAAGDVMYKDLDGDGKVNDGEGTLEKHGDLTIIGNTSPRYSYSFIVDVAYKGFDLSVMLQGIGKRDWWDSSPYSIGANLGKWQSVGFVEHWDFFRPEGDPLGANLNARFPRPIFGSGGKNFEQQTLFLQDASYLRIKNLQLGYTLPKHLIERLGMSNLRLYASVDNLATFTKLSKVFDPEAIGGDWGPGKIYPLQRTWAFGLNVNF
ncbi:MAG: TonB-dependent receptor [Porphyromonadaceae bacterium]|nr:TonB-dependent receptor [Porphyromonadaceae bacterium]